MPRFLIFISDNGTATISTPPGQKGPFIIPSQYLTSGQRQKFAALIDEIALHQEAALREALDGLSCRLTGKPERAPGFFEAATARSERFLDRSVKDAIAETDRNIRRRRGGRGRGGKKR